MRDRSQFQGVIAYLLPWEGLIARVARSTTAARGFPTADVILFGACLAVLVEKLQTQSLTAVLPLDARYAHALGQNPWVARIVVSRIDKQGSAAG